MFVIVTVIPTTITPKELVTIRGTVKKNRLTAVESAITETTMTLETATIVVHATATLVSHHLTIRPMTIITMTDVLVQGQEGPITQ